MKRIAIMGLGLMGGSLGLALKAQGFAGKIAGYARRAETRDEALRRKAVDEAFDRPEKAVAGADFVIFCVPILSIPGLVKESVPGLQPGCLVTDVGSTKADLTRQVRALLKGAKAVFVGSHPIAGSEQQGLDAARADLYRGAVVVVTPGSAAERKAAGPLKDFWEGLGAVVREMGPEEHDRMMARTSHLPHLVSALLASTVGRDGDPQAVGQFCGPGFRDTTRIAEGSPDVWHDIIRSNRESILAELEAFSAGLKELEEQVRKGDTGSVRGLLEKGRARRKELVKAKGIGNDRGDK